MGGWKASGLGSRHGADGIRKYTKRQSLMVTPGYAPARDAHHFPYSAQASRTIGETFAVLATSDLFSDSQRATLAALCDTFIPALEPPADDRDDRYGFWRRAASHAMIPEGVEVALLQAQLPDEQVVGLRSLLDSLAESGIVATTPQEVREQIVHAFSDQSPEALAAISTLRGIAATLYYALPDLGTGRNPTWDAIGYPGPITPPPDRPRPLRDPPARGRRGGDRGRRLRRRLRRRRRGDRRRARGGGKSVCVLEMGGYHDDRDFDQLELSAYQRLYLNGGPFPTAEGQVGVVAGTGVGGGTVVNWTNCLRTHDWVREEWAHEHGLEGLDGPEFDAPPRRRLGAPRRERRLLRPTPGPHLRLKEACEKLGYDFRPITRNADPELYDPASAAYMGFGDQSGSKQSTAKTYLLDAQRAGATIISDCRAERILVEDGRAAGVEAVYIDPEPANGAATDPRRRPRPRPSSSPAARSSRRRLLLRSGIGGPATGDYLRLHPTAAVTAFYDEPQDWCWGPPQAALSHEFADVGDGHGFLIEAAQSTTGLFAGAVPWRSGRDHKRRMSAGSAPQPLISLLRERGHGRVVDRRRRQRRAELPGRQRARRPRHPRPGRAARPHPRGGRRRGIVGSPQGARLEARRRPRGVHRRLYSPRSRRATSCFSAHQMGTLPDGQRPADVGRRSRGELHDTPGVWIGDASAFPTASGTNPMLTIMALARRTAARDRRGRRD